MNGVELILLMGIYYTWPLMFLGTMYFTMKAVKRNENV